MLSTRVRQAVSCVQEFYRTLSPIDLSNHHPFGAAQHGFLLRPPLPPSEVDAFEAALQSNLPDDYKHFVLTIGNGGAGPGYGLFSLGVQCEDPPGRTWREWEAWVLERLREPFDPRWPELPYTGSDPTAGSGPWSVAELRARVQEDIPPGAIAVSHRGCAEYDYLILNGPHRGEIWADALTSYSGGQRREGSLVFDEWYSAWLDSVVTAVRATPTGKNWHVEAWR